MSDGKQIFVGLCVFAATCFIAAAYCFWRDFNKRTSGRK